MAGCRMIARFSSFVPESTDRCAGEKDRKSTRLNSSHPSISYAVFCLKKKKEGNFLTLQVLHAGPAVGGDVREVRLGDAERAGRGGGSAAAEHGQCADRADRRGEISCA